MKSADRIGEYFKYISCENKEFDLEKYMDFRNENIHHIIDKLNFTD